MKQFAGAFSTLLVAGFMGTGQVSAHPIGNGSTVGLATNMAAFCNENDPDAVTSGVLTCTMDAPLGISAVAGAGYWQKQFPTSIVPGQFILTEKLIVGQPGLPGLNWSGWHEAFDESRPEWVWDTGIFSVVGGDEFQGTISSDRRQIDFVGFDLAPGTEVEIRKTFSCPDRNSDDCRDDSQPPLFVREWPSFRVPEPASLALLGLGLAGMALTRRGSMKR